MVIPTSFFHFTEMLHVASAVVQIIQCNQIAYYPAMMCCILYPKLLLYDGISTPYLSSPQDVQSDSLGSGASKKNRHSSHQESILHAITIKKVSKMYRISASFQKIWPYIAIHRESCPLLWSHVKYAGLIMCMG